MESMMRDPTTSSSRIYIGNLTDQMKKTDIEAHFSKFGTIVGILLNRGFGFIQFDNDVSATQAILTGEKNIIMGRKIIVRNAVKQTFGNNQTNTGSDTNDTENNVLHKVIPRLVTGVGQPSAPIQKYPIESSTPVDLNRTARMPINNQVWDSRNKRYVYRNPGGGHTQIPPVNPDRERSPLDNKVRDEDRWNRENNSNSNVVGSDGTGSVGGTSNIGVGSGIGGGSVSMGQQGVGPPLMLPGHNNPNQMVGLQYGGPIIGGPINFHRPPMNPTHPDANDCEIIVVSKLLTQYAEVIEARLKRVGLIVDLLFPNEDVPLGKVLANISSRGCLYAVLVTPQNEELRSITVNILYGTPAEHRNMPVDDAIDLIDNHFHELLRNHRMGISINSSNSNNNTNMNNSGSMSVPKAIEIGTVNSISGSSSVHPVAIQALFNLLADRRTLTVLQYDRIIKYLHQLRAEQLKIELGDDATTQMSIMSTLTATGGPPPPPVTTNATTILQKQSMTPTIDPNIELQKKILDILNKPPIIGDTLKESSKSATSVTSSKVVTTTTTTTTTTATITTILTTVTPSTSTSTITKSNSKNECPTQLLNDPKVQMALDSLLQGNMFNF